MGTATDFSFLLSGPRMSLETSLDLRVQPYLDSPVINGAGGRTFAFNPNPTGQEQLRGFAEEYERLDDLLTIDGRPMMVYQRSLEPLMWFLAWELSGGCMSTHLREEDTLDQASVTAQSIEIFEDPTPTLLVHSPLRPAIASSPGYAESVSFYPTETSGGASLRVIRPAFIEQGRFVSQDWGGWVSVRTGGPEGTEVQLNMTGEDANLARDILMETVDSMVVSSSVT